jgi:hypothetical protein
VAGAVVEGEAITLVAGGEQALDEGEGRRGRLSLERRRCGGWIRLGIREARGIDGRARLGERRRDDGRFDRRRWLVDAGVAGGEQEQGDEAARRARHTRDDNATGEGGGAGAFARRMRR